MSDFESRHSLPLARKIETATDSLESQPDEAAFLEICHHINQDKDGPAIALMAIINHLKQAAASDPKSAAFTLMLLDLCVKNCSYRFTRELCKDDYLETMKTLVDREDVTVGIHNRLLSLIQTWALAFSDNLDFKSIHDLYRELFNSGIKFPEINRNDIELLKHTLPPLQVLEAPRSAQRPAAANTRITYLMRAIRHDLDLTYLDLPAFEALLQGLSCNPPDTVTMKQLQASADRLDGLQRRLEAYIRQLSENMDTEPESIQEEQPMLDELIRVNDKILDGIQQFQSFEKMRCREEDEEKEKVTERMLNASTSGAAGTTLVTVAKQQEVQEALSEASSLATAPATAVTNVAEPPLARTNDVLQTLREAREALQLFYLLQQDIRASSAQVADRTLLGELRVVAERLEDLKKNVQTLINAKMRETSADLTGEAEANLASLTSVNEELLRCVENYRRYGTRQTTARNLGAQTTETAGTTVVTVASQPEAPKSSSAASSVATATPVASTGDAVGTRLAATTDVSRTLREAREGIQLFQTLQREMSASSAQMVDATTQIRELGIVAERLAGLQKRVHAHINGSISGNSAGNAEEDETTLANLTDVNDQLLHCLKNYQRTVQIDEPQETPEQILKTEMRKEAAPAVTNPPGASLPTGVKAMTATASPIPVMNAADANNLSRMLTQQTLLRAREAIQHFKALHEAARTSPAQTNHVTQIDELRTVGERLVDLQKEVHALINESLSGNCDGFTEEDERVLANLTSVNDELLLCAENYRQTLREAEGQLAPTMPVSVTRPGQDVIWNKSFTRPPTSTDSQVTLQYGTDQLPGLAMAFGSASLTDNMPASGQVVLGPNTVYDRASDMPPTSMDSQVTLQSQETPESTLRASTREEAVATPGAPKYLPTKAAASVKLIPAMDAAEPDLTKTNVGTRMTIQKALLQQAKEAIEQFKALQGDARTSPARMQMQMRELRTVGERLVSLQKEISELLSEDISRNTDGVTKGDETAIANLMEVNDELHTCVEDYQRTVRENEAGKFYQQGVSNSATDGLGRSSHEVSSDVRQEDTGRIYAEGGLPEH
uniref:VHS domain-containing protein n=1 Tax=Schistocephalus solidus TaxID=70667 RepID=A0A0X3PX43_SCHSO